MFIKHSYKNLLRSLPKSILFFLLLTTLGVTLCIGVSLTTAIISFLNECNENYTTIAVLEYIGANYPDETLCDPDIAQCMEEFDFSALADNPAVLNWDANDAALGSVAGKTADAFDAPYKKNVVAVIYILGYNDKMGVYHYSLIEDLVDPDTKPIAGFMPPTIVDLQPTHLYLVHGRLDIKGNLSITPFLVSSAEKAGVHLDIGDMIQDISTGHGNYEIPTDSLLYQIADTYNTVNKGVTVRATNDLEAYLPFQQADLAVVEGRSFSEGEYADGAKVCLLPERFAELVGVSIGDTVDLSIAVQAGASQQESYWSGTGFQYEDTYTVVGIFNPYDEYRDTVFIPKSGDTDLSVNRYSYTLGQARLKNDMADRFRADMSDTLPPRVRMTVYDQGYASVAGPMRDILRIAVIITAVCFLTTLAVLALFGFLFVYRQKDLAKIMRRLGAENAGIFSYFLFGSASVALLSAASGGFISLKLSSFFMGVVRQAAAGYRTSVPLYSNSALTLSRTIEFAPDVAPAVFVLTSLVLFIFAALACLIFANISIRANMRRGRRRRSVRRGAAAPRSSTPRSRDLNGGALKYAWLSVCRGASRSGLPVVLCALSAALLLQLSNTIVVYQASYDKLMLDTEISGYITDPRGAWRYGLLLNGIAINEFFYSGILSELSITKTGLHYAYNFDPPPNAGSFAIETYNNIISAGPGIIMTNDLVATQEFYGCTEIPVTFLDGYDVSTFSQFPPGEKPVDIRYRVNTRSERRRGTLSGVVSTAFLEENGLALGDTIEIVTAYMSYRTLHIIGSFTKQGSMDNIYVPLSSYHQTGSDYLNIKEKFYIHYTDLPSSYVYDQDPDPELLRQLSFSSVSFKLRGAADLGAFRNFLYERGYSEVHITRSVRSYITIEDKTFLTTERAMTQRMLYMEKVFPVLYVLLELLAALIPFILIQMRKRESALMRVQGAAKRTAFASIFTEQIMLCLPGLIIGAGIWLAVSGTPAMTGIVLTCAFALCWLFGAALSALMLNRGSVRSILKAEE